MLRGMLLIQCCFALCACVARASAEMLLEEMVREWGPAAAGALLAAVAGAWGRPGWKWREAGLQALGGCSEVLIEVRRG